MGVVGSSRDRRWVWFARGRVVGQMPGKKVRERGRLEDVVVFVDDNVNVAGCVFYKVPFVSFIFLFLGFGF